jgi:hypothetical protein
MCILCSEKSGTQVSVEFCCSETSDQALFLWAYAHIQVFQGGGNPFGQVHGRLILEADEVWCEK